MGLGLRRSSGQDGLSGHSADDVRNVAGNKKASANGRGPLMMNPLKLTT
jgi:hypothetical protein